MIRESLADSNQIQWQVLAKSLQLQLTDSRLWQVLYIYSSYNFRPMSMRDDNTVGLFYHEAASCIES